jgi:hypothetical protein
MTNSVGTVQYDALAEETYNSVVVASNKKKQKEFITKQNHHYLQYRIYHILANCDKQKRKDLSVTKDLFFFFKLKCIFGTTLQRNET